MAKDMWYDRFLETLSKKYSKKTQLAQALIELLNIEREAAYRRLRKDVIFPAHEIGKIAKEWNISLDELVGVNSGKISFQMQATNYLNPSEDDLDNLRERVKRLDHLKHYSDSEYLLVCNNLPRTLASGFETLYKFNIFKWMYEYGNNDGIPMPYSKMFIPKEVQDLIARYYKIMKTVGKTSIILDQMLFDHVVHDIKYFQSIYLITNEEIELIKKDLHKLLDYLLDVAIKGYYPETENKVVIYISKVNINTNYSYFYTEKLKICRVHAFNKYDVYTFDVEMVKNFRTWMQLKKRTSIQISEVDERSRVEFFTKQRQLVDSL